jgi:hypothetical protein
LFCFSEIDGDLFVAQAFIFLLAGYETSAGTLSFALYELALHPEIQQSVRAEILQGLSEQNGKLTYDSVQGMSYLDRVVSGEGQIRIKKYFNIDRSGNDGVNFEIVCRTVMLHKTHVIKKIPNVVKSKFLQKTIPSTYIILYNINTSWFKYDRD